MAAFEMDKRDEFPEDPWVRVMCDHSAQGVWNRNGSAGRLGDLPVSADIKRRLVLWQAEFEQLESKSVVDTDALHTFSDTGREIARDIKRELPDWTVVYFDERAYQTSSDDAERAFFEYQINLC